MTRAVLLLAFIAGCGYFEDEPEQAEDQGEPCAGGPGIWAMTTTTVEHLGDTADAVLVVTYANGAEQQLDYAGAIPGGTVAVRYAAGAVDGEISATFTATLATGEIVSGSTTRPVDTRLCTVVRIPVQ
jgi:hypothetical protein